MQMNVISRSKTRDDFGIAFAQCGRCAMPVTAIVQMHEATVDNWVANAGNDVLRDTKAQLIAVLPKASRPSAPDHVDKSVARVFVQAEGTRKRKELDNAGMAYRKTLDIGLKKFDATLKDTLYERIDALAARHDITTAMQEWAHQVRLIGNDANHEEYEPKEADIEARASCASVELTVAPFDLVGADGFISAVESNHIDLQCANGIAIRQSRLSAGFKILCASQSIGLSRHSDRTCVRRAVYCAATKRPKPASQSAIRAAFSLEKIP